MKVHKRGSGGAGEGHRCLLPAKRPSQGGITQGKRDADDGSPHVTPSIARNTDSDTIDDKGDLAPGCQIQVRSSRANCDGGRWYHTPHIEREIKMCSANPNQSFCDLKFQAPPVPRMALAVHWQWLPVCSLCPCCRCPSPCRTQTTMPGWTGRAFQAAPPRVAAWAAAGMMCRHALTRRQPQARAWALFNLKLFRLGLRVPLAVPVVTQCVQTPALVVAVGVAVGWQCQCLHWAFCPRLVPLALAVGVI